MVFTANYQVMACAACLIKKGKHIDVYLELILIQMDIVRKNCVCNNVEMVAVKHFFFVNSRSNAMFISLWKMSAFKNIKKRIAETALIVVLNIDYCLFVC